MREPDGHERARAGYGRNYHPRDYIGSVVEVLPPVQGTAQWQMNVRWNLPAAFGYDPERGTVATMLHIDNGPWLETRRRPRDVVATVATVTKISNQEYLQALERLLTEADAVRT